MNGLFHEVSGHQDGIEGTEKNGLTNPQEGRAERMPSSVLESLEGCAEKMDSSVLASLEGRTEKMNSSVLASLEGYTEKKEVQINDVDEVKNEMQKAAIKEAFERLARGEQLTTVTVKSPGGWTPMG